MARKSKPTRHRDKWRIRWIDANGKRNSEVYDDYEYADLKPIPIGDIVVYSYEYNIFIGVDHGSGGKG